VLCWCWPVSSSREQKACLEIIDEMLETHPRCPLGLLQTRAGSLGGGPCGDRCNISEHHTRCDTYDNALAAIYLVKRRKYAQAKTILDVFIKLIYPHDPSVIDRIFKYTATSSGRVITLLASAYSTEAKAYPGDYSGRGLAEDSVDTGNNAWAALAFAHYAAHTQKPCYATVARDIVLALNQSSRCTDPQGGFTGRMQPTTINYRATEHNIDLVGVARMLKFEEVMNHAKLFTMRMYKHSGANANSYTMGGVTCFAEDPRDDTQPVPADAIYWNLLADADDNFDHMRHALEFALSDSPQPVPPAPLNTAAACCLPGSEWSCCSDKSCCSRGKRMPCCLKTLSPAGPPKRGLWEEDVDLVWRGPGLPRLNGTRFTSGGHGVQFEVTAGAGMAILRYKQKYGKPLSDFFSRRLQSVRDSLRHLLGMYGGVPASVLGGNFEAFAERDYFAEFPGGSDTGIHFTYLRYRHIASTMWTGLFLMYQDWEEDGDAIWEDANPFMPPSKPMPTDVDRSCFPWLHGVTPVLAT